MGRILGKVEYGAGEPDRFFIHCDTAGNSFAPLFTDSAEAWRIYGEGDVDALRAAAPKRSTVVRAIRKVLAHSFNYHLANRTVEKAKRSAI